MFRKALEYAGVYRKTTYAAILAMFAGLTGGKRRYYINGLEFAMMKSRSFGVRSCCRQWRPSSVLCRTRNTPAPVLSPEALSPQGVKTGRDRRKAEKQKQAHIRRLRRQEAELLAGQEALETEKAALEAELDQPAVYSSVEKARAVQARLDQVSMEAEENLRKWEVRAEELEKALAGDFRT